LFKEAEGPRPRLSRQAAMGNRLRQAGEEATSGATTAGLADRLLKPTTGESGIGAPQKKSKVLTFSFVT